MFALRKNEKLKPEYIEHFKKMGMKEESYKPGESLIRQGEKNDEMIIIIEGLIKLIIHDMNGNSKFVGIASSNEVVGVSGMFTHNETPASVITVTEVKVYSINREILMKIVNELPDFREYLFRIMGTYIEYYVNCSIVQSYMTTEVQLAYVLLNLATRFGISTVDNTVEIQIDMTDVLLGEIVGARRETVTRIMSKLRENKVISKNKRRVLIHDLKELELMVQG